MTDDQMGALFARLDERTKHIEEQIGTIVARMEKDYVSQSDFRPVRNIVYGMVAFVLAGFAAALVALVWPS